MWVDSQADILCFTLHLDGKTSFGDQVTGITGKPEHVLQLAKDWGVFWERIETSGGGYTLNHTSTIFLLNGQGRMTGTIDISEPTDVVEDKLKKLVARL